jgi:hypothetical protein
MRISPQPADNSPTREQVDEESRKIRRLRIAVTFALQLIAAGDLPLDEAQELASATQKLALTLFPGKEAVYDLIYGTKFRRLIAAIYSLN